MPVRWTNVRITQETAEALLRVLERLETPTAQRKAILPRQRSETRSWDFAIRLLLERNERHVRRGRQPRGRKWAPGPARTEPSA